MSTHKRSAFFDILKTYAPDYEPKKHDEAEKKAKPVNDSEKENANNKKNENDQDHTNKKKDQSHKEHHKKKPVDHSKSFDREKTQEFERQRREKNLQSYDKWQLVKQTVKEEETDRLKEKIYLQLQLIKYQELAYQQKIHDREDEKAQERARQKALKRAKAQELLEHCKQSLADDRQKKQQQKSRNRTKSNATTTVAFNTPLDLATSGQPGDQDNEQRYSAPTSASPTKVNTSEKRKEPKRSSPSNLDDPPSRLPTKVLLDDSEDEKDLPTVSPSVYERQRREGTDISSVASLSNTPTPGKQSPVTREVTTNITREMTRASTLPEEDEDYDEDLQEEEVDEFAEYPWYQQQLYHLYGRKDADFFLHPKVEAKAKKKAKTIDPKFKNPDGRTGANELWTNLRRESQGKILKVDASIPDELKVAFNCLARESVAKLKKPIRRSYSVKDDGQELDQLLDQSVVQDAQNYRHRMELMYRSSQKNEDRFRVLSFNNPLPNLNNEQGQESVSRYIASWMEEDYDADSELSYKKYLLAKDSEQNSRSSSKAESIKENKDTLPQIAIGNDINKLDDTQSDVLPSEWDFMLMRKPTREKKNEARYLFLTERDATTPGQFRKRREEALAAKQFPGAYKPKEGSQSAHYPAVGTTDPSVTLPAPSASAYRSGHSAYAVSTEFTLSGEMTLGGNNNQHPNQPRSQSTIGVEVARDFPLWEPLSMQALVEYKKKEKSTDCGDYAQGKAPTWNARTTMVN